LATCAGIYVLGFCRQRGLPTEGIHLIQKVEADPRTGMVAAIGIEIQVPPEFPERYRDALTRAASQCAVKKHLEAPPRMEVRTVVAEPLPTN